MKSARALTHENRDRSSATSLAARAPFPRPWELSPRRALAGADPLLGRFPRQLLVGALAGELATVVFLFASGTVPPALVRSLQLFLRF